MHIIVLGGGAAGMISAHYLAKEHQVTVIERESVLGGNVRTLNGNIASSKVPAGLFIDNGVIEFHRDYSPALKSVLEDLDLELEPICGGSSALFLENRTSIHMPGAIQMQEAGVAKKLARYARLGLTLRHLVPLCMKMYRHSSDDSARSGDILGPDPLSQWIRMLLMYGYSIPFQHIDDFPARLAIPTLRQGSIGTRWVRLPGGTFSYIQRIVDRASANLKVITGADVVGICRGDAGVTLTGTGINLEADKIVVATPPAQVLRLMIDPDRHESALFAPWRENRITTLIHTDTKLYDNWGNPGFTEFDVFEKSGGTDAGYNAYLNRLCGLPGDHPEHYFLAYNLEDRIDPEKVIHSQLHLTPWYTSESYSSVTDIRARNGMNNTYYCGAYLYNGLHEGAAQSALAVCRQLLDPADRGYPAP